MSKLLSFPWFIWFVLVVLWNFGYPEATPIFDVLIAIVLSLLLASIKKYEK
jgi:hypothetical protein